MSQRVSWLARAHVLAPAADRQRELLVRHTTTSTRPASSSITTLVTSAGARAFTTKVGGLGRPGDDVDLLTL